MTPRETADVIIAIALTAYGVTRVAARGRSRQRNTVRARHLACYLLRRWTDLSSPEIGSYLDRDHTTVLSAIEKMRAKACDPVVLDADARTWAALMLGSVAT